MGIYLYLQFAVLIYSVNTICGKMASAQEVFSLPFFLWLIAEVLVLGVYALLWQQAIKKVELSVGYANKSVNLLWTLLWSVLLFHDSVTVQKIGGIALVIGGTLIMNSTGKSETPPEQQKEEAK